MGCDIHSIAQKRDGSGAWVTIPDFEPFEHRSYRVFAFLAGVRNYAAVTPISEPRGLPEGVEQDDDEWWDCHSKSWLTVDYDATVEDRRIDGGGTCEPGTGVVMTYREFLGAWFFKALCDLKDRGAERVVFAFDS